MQRVQFDLQSDAIWDEVSKGDAAAIHKFLLNCCASSILEQVDSCIRMERRVLGPPATKCYSCSRRLVSYLTTNVKLYTCEGVKRREKVALQCKECNLIYSLTQFGNKHLPWFSVLSRTATSCGSH